MRTVNIHAAKTNLSSLLEEVEKGEEIVIARAGKPVAKLVPFAELPKERKPGILRGQAWAAPDAWDPDPELERLFYEGDPRFPSKLDDCLEDMRVKGQAPEDADA
ncbi:type II toxin-antitoxin system Phd/YefM family antitoxin [Benzoatithermus flavus]|uniref:Antitoxin n=1 Tax=Benzoatithermus flavus TaxID=3108223 RepID=A0ABU8XKE6_9PROT